ncbi:MAG: precorrin-3B C(17)-methyltransferase [Desulfovibrionaceae bacterium]
MSLGPGDAGLLAPLARQALETADVLVGYTGYLDLVDPGLRDGREVIATGMTGEVSRAGAAVEAALLGRRVAVVCSGDAGVYAMAGLLIEVMEARGALERIDFEVVPGIPALTAAAALAGAPLMHDFCAVSLSDLLTDWALIERRLQAAAEADFVVCLYNPRSRRRADHLARALEIIGRSRDPQTPVAVVSRAYRPGQQVTVMPLAEVDPEAVDMQTICIVGNSQTRLAGGWMVTPRGYDSKYRMGG